MGLRQDEPQSREKRWWEGFRSRPETRDAPDGSGGGGTGQGEAFFSPKLPQALSICEYDAGKRPFQTGGGGNKVLSAISFRINVGTSEKGTH